jgi:hypothetical protein
MVGKHVKSIGRATLRIWVWTLTYTYSTPHLQSGLDSTQDLWLESDQATTVRGNQSKLGVYLAQLQLHQNSGL